MRFLLVPSGAIRPIDSLTETNTLLRCEAALKLLRAGHYDYAVLSGGICFPASIARQPAATTMMLWFFQFNDVAAATLIDTKARDSFENVAGAMAAIGNTNQPITHLGVVSEQLHAQRLALTFKNMYGLTVERHFTAETVPPHQAALEHFLYRYHQYDTHGTKALARWNRARRTFERNSQFLPRTQP